MRHMAPQGQAAGQQMTWPAAHPRSLLHTHPLTHPPTPSCHPPMAVMTMEFLL